MHLELFHYCMKLSAKWAELVQLMQKIVPRIRVEIFCIERTESNHWTINPLFGAFCSVWMHLESFHYGLKLGVKRAELVQLMQKFVPRSRVRIFHNVCSRSTPLDPELLFWCISFYLGAFGTISLLHKTCRKTRQNMSLGSNGMDCVHSLTKISM